MFFKNYKHKLASIKPPIPLPVDGMWLIGPKLGTLKNGQFEPEVVHFFTSRLKATSFFADVGPQYGIHTVNIARRFGKAEKRVYVFEPSVLNQRRLKRNLFINNCLANVEIVPVFVGSKMGNQVFDLDNETGFEATKSKNCLHVTSITLDSLGIDFTLCKIDAEGYDIEVLRGASRLISQGCEFTFEIGKRFSDVSISERLDEIRSFGLKIMQLSYGEREPTNREIESLVEEKLHINLAAVPS